MCLPSKLQKLSSGPPNVEKKKEMHEKVVEGLRKRLDENRKNMFRNYLLDKPLVPCALLWYERRFSGTHPTQ